MPSTNNNKVRPRLYLLSPATINLDEFEGAFTKALDAGDVACFQLRLKDRPIEEIREATKRLMPIAAAHDVAFILNDDPEAASDLGCDGVHVGQDDTPYADARRIMGPDAIVGVTCKASKHLAMDAADKGADYVAFGAFFPSPTKDATTKADPSILKWWSDIAVVPCVAIGGITADNALGLLESGADFLCVASGVWDYEGGAGAGVAAFNRVIDQWAAT
ncbi:MAG: thiamine phosphate synthase [Sneathiella sp.]|nr:MAG: thiamine phosphate synthase [Sneathiella sp.]